MTTATDRWPARGIGEHPACREMLRPPRYKFVPYWEPRPCDHCGFIVLCRCVP